MASVNHRPTSCSCSGFSNVFRVPV